MKKLYVLLVVSCAFLIAACGGSTDSSPSRGRADANANKEVVIDTTSPGNMNVNIAENPIPPGFDPTNGNRSANRAKMEMPKKLSMPAPDNSEIFTELKDVPVETRVFKDHPVLIKVIKSGIPPKQTVKAYLKGGKVMDIPADKLPNLSNEPAIGILTLLGIDLPEGPNPGRDAAKKAAETKKTQADQ